jgi:hypothetical protein
MKRIRSITGDISIVGARPGYGTGKIRLVVVDEIDRTLPDALCACGHVFDEHEPAGPCSVERLIRGGRRVEERCSCAHFERQP